MAMTLSWGTKTLLFEPCHTKWGRDNYRNHLANVGRRIIFRICIILSIILAIDGFHYILFSVCFRLFSMMFSLLLFL